ncbi:MAG: 1-acyl-sn-glycerol-3-phosphate acyltransferase, partial [Bacteriovoracaceae bacterium]|nr:1-acyl-sn-glycerol-3-phosphate acyltransferase [Bacteriovoracaceae bacterium]
MKTLISFTLLHGIRVFAKTFFKFETKWLGNEKESWDDIRYIVLLNHTSLFEPIYLGAAPFSFVNKLSKKMVAPGADKTLNRPIVGKFWKSLGPGMISISRKRDSTWKAFMQAIKNKSIIIIAAEGRMKRANGLDANGRPMTVRSGVADILEQLEEGKMLIAYSGGLHHIQVPGQRLPRLFKTVRMNFELLNISEYKASFPEEGIKWKRAVVDDMQNRLETRCP